MSIGLTLVFLTLLHLYYGILALKFITGAGYKSWQALLPFYNIYIMTKVIKRPWWWTALAILPVVGNVMMAVIFFELLHMYRIADVKNTVIGILTAGLYFGYLGYSSPLKYQDRDLKIIRKYISEGFASIVFAVIAATLIRAYTFEAFTIPTPSMERSMMVGDFLFVSKLQYGSRLPMTPFSFPLMHNKVPFTEIKAFSGAVQFPYLRLPKLSDVERNDPVVFNYPRQLEYPVDKRDHYVKRCLGLPGDTLQIKNLEVYVNGSLSQMPERADAQFQYYVRTKNGRLGAALELKERYDINPIESGDYYEIGVGPGYAEYLITISESEIEQFKQDYPQIDTIFPLDLSRESVKKLPKSLKIHGKSIVSGGVFPNSAMMGYGKASGIGTNWTRDNFGPIHIPKANTTVDLTINNYKLYKAIIEDYEGHDLKVIRPSKGNPNHEFQIDGELVNSYTFEQDYYWMMGDNRHNSEDSRYWGFVPEDHIVGKPVFIWMSFDKYGSSLFEKIRFDRVFTTVSGDGERRSYFWPFMVVLVGVTIFNRWRKKKKASAA